MSATNDVSHHIAVLDSQNIRLRRAHDMIDFAAADLSRIRQAKLSRLTIDRMMAMLDRLDQDVEVTMNVQPRSGGLPKVPIAV